MQPDYSPLIDAMRAPIEALLPYFLFVLVFVVALKVIERRFGRRGKGRWRSQRGGKVVLFQPRQDRLPDAADQLRTVMNADFKAQPLLNKSEARLFKAINKMVIDPSTGSGQDLRRRAGR